MVGEKWEVKIPNLLKNSVVQFLATPSNTIVVKRFLRFRSVFSSFKVCLIPLFPFGTNTPIKWANQWQIHADEGFMFQTFVGAPFRFMTRAIITAINAAAKTDPITIAATAIAFV